MVALSSQTEAVSDEMLMERFQRGDANAFRELLGRHQHGVFHYFFRLLRNKQAAEEATQEAFLHIVRASRRYEPRARFTTWMYRIVHNYGIDCLRRAKHRRTVSLDAPLGSDGSDERTLLDTVHDQEEADQEVEASRRQMRSRLDAALATLNPDQREVFVMRESLGLAFHEIAASLDVSTNTVKSRMRYALAALRKALAKDAKSMKQAAEKP